MKLKLVKINPAATLPEYAHPGDAAMDLFCAQETKIEPRGRGMIPTGIAFEIPDGFVGLIWDRSGLAAKGGLTTMAGVIDSGFRGEVTVVMHNTTEEAVTFNAGDKIAQMLIQPVERPSIEVVQELSSSTRGTKAWGSTGMGAKHR